MFNCVTAVPYPSVHTGWGGSIETVVVPPDVQISWQILYSVFALLGGFISGLFSEQIEQLK
jgi:hypothetical protein